MIVAVFDANHVQLRCAIRIAFLHQSSQALNGVALFHFRCFLVELDRLFDVAFGADSSSSSLAGRARIAGAWIYMPWGLVGFRVNGCAGVQPLTLAELNSDDSWNFGGRIWARSLYACGQTHFRVPPSSSASLSALANAPSSADINFVAWTGQDWVARASSGRTIGSVN